MGHTHPPDYNAIDKIKHLNRLNHLILTSPMQTTQLIDTFLESVPEEVRKLMPKKDVMRRNVRRKRQEAAKAGLLNLKFEVTDIEEGQSGSNQDGVVLRLPEPDLSGTNEDQQSQ